MPKRKKAMTDYAIAEGLAAAMRDYIGKGKIMTQVQLAAAMGVDQSLVSQWSRGVTMMPLRTILELETVLGLRAGALLASAGIIGDVDLIRSIYADPYLGANEKAILVDFYETLKARSSRPGEPLAPG